MNKIYAFADISGFTPLTAAMIAKSRYGAEEVSDLVNSVFGGIINTVHENGGAVLHFAGDALLFTVDLARLEICKEHFSRHIESYNRNNNVSLSISIDIFTEKYYPHKMKYKNNELLFFSTGKGKISYNSIKNKFNPEFPKQIRDMKKRGFVGELRTLPISFIHIKGKYTTEKLFPLLKKIYEICIGNDVYLNKIEYADKGWMLLLGAGMPIPIKNANLILYKVLEQIRDLAKEMNMEAGIGITLQRGFAGIIGNEARWEFTYMGNNVNLAARMAVNAKNYSILCDKYMQESLNRYYDIENSESVKYKGMNTETKIFRLQAISAQEENSIFVGREKLITDIQQHIKREKTAVIITGEGGVGKTSLVRKLESISDNPYIYMSGERREIPFSAIMSIDNKIEKYIRKGVILKGTNAKERFFEVIGSLNTEISIVVDNAHLLDPQSLNIVKWLLIEGNRYVTIIIVQRPVNRFTAHRSPLSKYDTAEYMLQGFNRDTVRSLIKAYFDADPDSKSVNHIFRLSQGNPLYITQLVNYLIKDNLTFVKNSKLHINIDLNKLPYSLKELILMKFDSLKNIEKQFIETGSVIGDEFRNDIPASVSDNMKNVGNIIENAASNKLLSPKDKRISMFYHNIVRETIYDRMLKKDVDRICVKIGDYLGKSDEAFDLFQAGRFYSIANDKRSADLFIAAANSFNKKHEYEYAAHSLKNVFTELPDSNRVDRAMDILKNTGQYHMDGELLESAYNAMKNNKYSTSNKNYLLNIGEYFTEMQRNVDKANELLNIYEENHGDSMQSNLLRATIFSLEERTDEARDIYKSLLKKMKDKESIMRILIPFAYLSFMLRSDKRDTEYALSKMRSTIKSVRDSRIRRDYYDFMITYNIHTNNLKKGAFYASRQRKLAKKYNDRSTLAKLLNTYAIIYSSKAVKEKKSRYRILSQKYSKKLYEAMKRNMQMNALPLITTNLAMSYMKAGMAEKALELYYEALLYGREINHFIEIPYNLGIIAGFALNRGAKQLALKICDEIESDFEKSDMTVLSGTIISLIKDDKEIMEEAVQTAERFLQMGHPMPYMFHFSALFNLFIRELNIKRLSALRKDMEVFLDKSNLRPAQESDIREKIHIIKMISGKTDIPYIRKFIRESKKIALHRDSIVFYCSIACRSVTGNDRIAFAREGYRYAKRMLMPLYAEEFSRILKECNYNKYYYAAREKSIHTCRMNIVKTENIPQFIDLIKTL